MTQRTNQELLEDRGYVVFSSTYADQVGTVWRGGEAKVFLQNMREADETVSLLVIAETDVEDYRAQGPDFAERYCVWPHYYRVVAE